MVSHPVTPTFCIKYNEIVCVIVITSGLIVLVTFNDLDVNDTFSSSFLLRQPVNKLIICSVYVT